MKCRLSVLLVLLCFQSFSQTQTCPVNINYASGDLTHWYAYTGNNMHGNGPGAIEHVYDSTEPAPSGTIGVRSILESNLNSVYGIQINTFPITDPFGGFPTVPTINGYTYNYSIKLGSTAVTRGNQQNGGGGYVRGVSYKFTVPAGPATVPYTMTYAYAMVLENGTHISSQQPLISATVSTPSGVITCASPSYYLPTFNNVTEGGRGATLDSATAKRNGFSLSGLDSPNSDPGQNTQGSDFLQDVWVKGWTEVTFDLSPYRGQEVSLTFEADNCIPGGHFAYGYIAVRNSCAGLEISGQPQVCNNSIVTYSVPALAGAHYNWLIPDSWQLVSSDTSNIIQIKTSNLGGIVSVREKNSCANLTDTIQIKTLPSPVAGNILGSTAVCEGENTTVLKLQDYSGSVLDWLSSTDSIHWTHILNNSTQYTAANLDSSTFFKVRVGKGDVCPPDTSREAVILVDKKSLGGQIDPPESVLCAGQTAGETLTLSANYGEVRRWQFSEDGNNWFDTQPADTNLVKTVKGITVNTQFRAVVSNGVCPADTSSVVRIDFNPARFPVAQAEPADTTICFGTVASLNANIDIGTSYAWSSFSTGNSNIGSTPYALQNPVSPVSSTNYILRVMNSGCPNALIDTFHVSVLDPVVVNAGKDTSVVVGEPLQFHAVSSDAGPDTFLWSPSTNLSSAIVADPQAVYSAFDNTIRYAVKATTPFGCTGVGYITVKVFKTRPDIFVPNAFTPGLEINSVFRPVPVGISSIEYFRIYNRLGQLVYSTSSLGRGWDGRLDGVPQDSGGYVWMVKGTDYTGNIIQKKGMMVLVR